MVAHSPLERGDGSKWGTVSGESVSHTPEPQGDRARPVRIVRARSVQIASPRDRPDEGAASTAVGEEGRPGTRATSDAGRKGEDGGVERGGEAAGFEVTERIEGIRPERLENSAAVTRGVRQFLWGFSLPGLALWAVFLGVVLTSPYEGVRTDPVLVATMSVLLVVVILTGYALTLGRTPIRFRFDRGRSSLEVQTLVGGWDRYKVGKEAFQVAIEVHKPDLFSRTTTELVEVRNPPYRRRRWNVERHMLDRWLSRHPGRTSTRISRSSLDLSEPGDLGPDDP